MSKRISNHGNLIVKTMLSEDNFSIEVVDIFHELVYFRSWNIKENDLVNFSGLIDNIRLRECNKILITSNKNEVNITSDCLNLRVGYIGEYKVIDNNKPVLDMSSSWFSMEKLNFEKSIEIGSDDKPYIGTYFNKFDVPHSLKHLKIKICIPYFVNRYSGEINFLLRFDFRKEDPQSTTIKKEEYSRSTILEYIAEDVSCGWHYIELFATSSDTKLSIPCPQDRLEDLKDHGYITFEGK